MTAPEEPKAKLQRACHTLATLGLMAVALMTVATICFSVIHSNDPAATTLLATLATGALSALIVLSGGKNDSK